MHHARRAAARRPEDAQAAGAHERDVAPRLLAHCAVLEAEEAAIAGDLQYVAHLTAVYGPHWEGAVGHLRQLLVDRQGWRRDIRAVLASATECLQQARLSACRAMEEHQRSVQLGCAAVQEALAEEEYQERFTFTMEELGRRQGLQEQQRAALGALLEGRRRRQGRSAAPSAEPPPRPRPAGQPPPQEAEVAGLGYSGSLQVAEDKLLCAAALGQLVVLGLEGGVACLYDTGTGVPEALLRGPARSPVCSVATAGVVGRIASGHEDGSVLVWDADTYHLLADVAYPGADTVWALVVVAGGLLVSGDGSGVVAVYDLGGPLMLTKAQAHTGAVQCLCTVESPHGGRLVCSGSEDAAVVVWEVDVGRGLRPRHRLVGHTDTVACLWPAGDAGGQLASGGGEGSLRLWDVAGGREVETVDAAHAQGVAAGCVVWGLAALLTAGRDVGAQCSLRLWYHSPLGLCCVWQMPGRATLLLPLGLGVLADAEALGRLTVWSLATALLPALPRSSKDPELSAMSHLAQERARVAMAELQARQALLAEEEAGRTTLLDTGGTRHQRALWRRRALQGRAFPALKAPWQCAGLRAGHPSPGLTCLAVVDWPHASGPVLGTCTVGALAAVVQPEAVALYDWAGQQPEGRLTRTAPVLGAEAEGGGCPPGTDPSPAASEELLPPFTCLAPLLELGLLATGHEGGAVWLWCADRYRPLAPLATGQRGDVAALLARAALLLCASEDGTVAVCSVAARRVRQTLRHHAAAVRGLCWVDPDLLCSGAADATVAVWEWHPPTEAFGLQPLHVLRGHPAAVTGVAALPEGRLASGSAAGDVRLWQPGTGLCLAVLPAAHTGGVTQLAAVGAAVLSSGPDGQLRVWDVDCEAALRCGVPAIAVAFDCAAGWSCPAADGGAVWLCAGPQSLSLWAPTAADDPPSLRSARAEAADWLAGVQAEEWRARGLLRRQETDARHSMALAMLGWAPAPIGGADPLAHPPAFRTGKRPAAQTLLPKSGPTGVQHGQRGTPRPLRPAAQPPAAVYWSDAAGPHICHLDEGDAGEPGGPPVGRSPALRAELSALEEVGPHRSQLGRSYDASRYVDCP